MIQIQNKSQGKKVDDSGCCIDLCRGVLEQALIDLGYQDPDWFLIQCTIRLNERLAAYYSAIKWLYSDKEEHVFSFSSICDLINIDPVVVRKAILKKVIYEPEIKKFLQWMIHQDYVLTRCTEIRILKCQRCRKRIILNEQYYQPAPDKALCYRCFMRDKTIPTTERWVFDE